MTARFAAALALGCIVGPFVMVSAPAASVADVSKPAVIVIGVPDLRFDQLSPARTPVLWHLAAGSALGALSVKAADPVSCPADGWLTLGAGDRASDGTDSQSGRCPPLPRLVAQPTSAGVTVAGFAALRSANRAGLDATELGSLADALAGAGQCVSAAGGGAAVAAADSRGQVASYRTDASAAAGDADFLGHCPVTLLSATTSDVDQLASAVLATAPAGAVLLLVGVSEAGGSTAHLHVGLARGSGFDHAELVSASTRRAPFVQLVDVAPTVLALRGVARPSSMVGQPWRSTGERRDLAAEVARLRDLDVAAQRQSGAIVPFYVAESTVMVLACIAAWWLARRRRMIDDASRDRRLPADQGLPGDRTVRIVALACTAAALIPASSFLAGLVPWWRSQHPLLMLAGATVLATVATTLAAWWLAAVVWRRRPYGLAAAVGLVTVAVIGADLVSGGHLQMFTMAGYSPLVAGRFAGIGNVGFGVLAAGAILWAGGAAESVLATASGPMAPAATAHPVRTRVPAGLRARVRNPLVGAVALVGLVAVALDGAPTWGGDVGGVLALVPAFAALTWTVMGTRPSWRRLLATAGGAIGAVGVLGAIDYARPADRQTHLGRFVGDLLHGGAWTVVHRKMVADGRLLTHSALTLAVPVLVVAAVAIVARPPGTLRRAFTLAPILRGTLIGVLVMAVIASVVNDSGVAIPALVLLVVLPAVMAVAVVAVVAGAAPPEAPRPPESGPKLIL
ncbi:MAG: hypothetical protein QOJ62_721 [Actinomycetota bacterium]|nr:hypothetical protein [Actinomycetota bacterium]